MSKRILVLNAFSLNMLLDCKQADVVVQPIDKVRARGLIYGQEFTSAVGHRETSLVLSTDLGVEIQTNRLTVKITEGDTVVVCQYSGPRLPEGATKLPEGAKIQYYRVWVTYL